MRIPFDSLCLAAVVDEAQVLCGGRVQRVAQWDATTVGLGVYRGREQWLLLSADARYARAHLMARRPDAPREPPPFCMALRKHITDSRVSFVRQRGLDRIVEIGFATGEGDVQIIAELMGKHSNIVLIDARGKVLAAAKVVGAGKSKRPIIPGQLYEPPPFEPRPSMLDAKAGDDLSSYEGCSPFVRSLIKAGTPLEDVQEAVREHRWRPVYIEGIGAYPLIVASHGDCAVPRDSISQAIEQHFASLIESEKLTGQSFALTAQLRRVLSAREKALQEIDAALDAASRAGEWQRQAELVLAYQSQVATGDERLVTSDYDGAPITIGLDPTLSAVENAQRLFRKAKRAKESAGEVRGQQARLQRDREDLQISLHDLERATDIGHVEKLRASADARRWLHHPVVARRREERPYEGHPIHELLSPGGWKVLYGDNATSNDFLTTRVAKSNDLWFHVRGATSAHVVLLTQNHPARVQLEDLLFAARLAVSKSASKHSSYVAVDYTLKKHVRKPKKSAAGAVTYSQEKTLHVEQ